MERNSDPRYIGPGAWSMLHLAAKRADVEGHTGRTGPRTSMFLGMVEMYRESFPCGDCRKHFDDFCKINPPILSDNKQMSAFHWSWRAHNNANIITGKPPVDFEVADKWWSHSGCESGCGMDSDLSSTQSLNPNSNSNSNPSRSGSLPFRVVSRDYKW